MAARSDVELIIRARDQATQGLKTISASMKKLSEQQTILKNTGDKADGSLSSLGAEVAKFQTNLANLSALKGITGALDAAAEAMVRQRSATEQASESYLSLGRSQQEAKQRSASLSEQITKATSALESENAALREARTARTQMNRDSRSLSTEEGRLTRSLASTTAAIEDQRQKVEEARVRQQQLAQQLSATESPTKRLQQSYESATRALTAKADKLASLEAKERDYTQQLQSNRAAQEQAAKGVTDAQQAYERQQQSAQKAKAAVSDLSSALRGSEANERKLGQQVESASDALTRQKNVLNQAESEYRQIEDAAAQARQQIGATAQTSDQVTTASQRAGVQLATLAARMRTLQSAGRGTGAPSMFDAEGVRKADAAIKQALPTIEDASNELTRSTISSRELTTALRQVGSAEKDLNGIASAVSRQATAVDGARNAWKTAEAEVKRLALAMREADEPSEQLASALGRAQGQARLAKTAFQQQEDAAERMATSLQEAGVGTGTLASAQEALANRSRAAQGALQRGQQAAASYSGSARSATGSASGLNRELSETAGAGARATGGIRTVITQLQGLQRESRQSMSLLQRFRGELLSMAAGAVGLYAIKRGIESIVDAGNELEANQAKLATAFGSIEEGNKELAYARQVAEDLKLPLNALSSGYANLAVAAKDGKLEGEGARKVFVAFAQAARVNRTSVDDLNGVYKALTQSISKGKIQAEELRGQLGDRLPGALQLMATGLGITQQKLEDMLDKGELTSDALVYMAAQVSQRVAPQLAEALDSPQAKMQELANQWTKTKETLAESGFLDSLGDAAQRLAQALASPEGQQAIKNIGEGLSEVARVIAEDVIPNLDLIIPAIAGIAGAIVTFKIASSIWAMVEGAIALRAALFAAIPAAAGLTAALGWIGAILGAISLAVWAYNNSLAFREFVADFKQMVRNLWIDVVDMWKVAGENIQHYMNLSAAKVERIFTQMAKAVIDSISGVLEAVGQEGLVNSAAANLDAVNKKIEDLQSGHTARLRKIYGETFTKQLAAERAYQEELAALREQFAKKEEGDAKNDIMDGLLGAMLVNRPDKPFVPGGGGGSNKERLSLEKQLATQMYTIRSKLAKKSAETDAEIEAGVRAQYQKTYDLLEKLGKDRNSEEWKTVDALVAQETKLAIQKRDKEAIAAAAREAREQEEAANTAMGQVNKLLQLRRELQKQIKYLEESNDPTQRNKIEEYRESLNDLEPRIQEAIAAAEVLVQLMDDGPDKTNLQLALDKLKISASSSRDEMTEVGKQMTATFTQGATAGIKDSAEALYRFASGAQSLGQTFSDVKNAFLNFAANFLSKIAEMIIQQQILNALQASSGAGGWWGSAIGAVTTAMNHTGGIAGVDSSGTAKVHPAVFANAVRYHTGGIAGLKPNEVATVLERGEEVLPKEDPRHRNNGGLQAAGGAQSPMSFKIVNTIDSGSVISQGLSTRTGERAILNAIRANKTEIKRTLG